MGRTPTSRSTSGAKSRSTSGAKSRSSKRRRRGRHRGRRIAGILALVLVPVALLSGCLFLAAAAIDAFAPRDDDRRVAGYGADQLMNACTIIGAGRDLGFGERDQTIAVMTAMGESSLRNLPYGDWETNGVRNPDGTPTTSIGLFQQQDGWGTRDQRLDPYTAATLFYAALSEHAPDREELTPTAVAHRVQVNDDPNHYARYWDRAVQVVAAVTAPVPKGEDPGIPTCPA